MSGRIAYCDVVQQSALLTRRKENPKQQQVAKQKDVAFWGFKLQEYHKFLHLPETFGRKKTVLN